MKNLKECIYAQGYNVTAAPWIMEPFGEIGAYFLYNPHREHCLLKLVIKKLSPKINVKNIKN